jgi:protein AATF/BFR2
VHEKAQNFAVPIPLPQGWHEEQVDELFSSLFGGVGMAGATAEGLPNGLGNGEGGSAGLGGLRVF